MSPPDVCGHEWAGRLVKHTGAHHGTCSCGWESIPCIGDPSDSRLMGLHDRHLEELT
jgi:hypothetical protein